MLSLEGAPIPPIPRWMELACLYGWSGLNRLSLGWRRLARWPWPGLRLELEDKAERFDHLPPSAHALALDREQELLTRFRIRLDEDTLENYMDTLEYVDVLATALDAGKVLLPPRLSALDMGCRSWNYVRGLYHVLRFHAEIDRSLALTGLEIDPFVRFDGGYSRWDYARLYSGDLPGCQYRVGDALRHHTGRYDFISLFYPYWRPYEALDAGLPLSCADARKLIMHTRRLLNPGGHLLVTAYGSEKALSERAIQSLPWEPTAAGRWKSPYLPDRTSTLWTLFRKDP